MRNSTCPDDRARLLCCKNMNGLNTHNPLPSTRIDTPPELKNISCEKFQILFYFTLQIILPTKSPHPMLELDELDLDITIYEPWDFHDHWNSQNFPLGGQMLLRQAWEGHLSASFFVWEKWMKMVSRDTQQVWHEHQSKNPLGSLNIPLFHPKSQSQNGHSHLLNLFEPDHDHLEPDADRKPETTRTKGQEWGDKQEEIEGLTEEAHRGKERVKHSTPHHLSLLMRAQTQTSAPVAHPLHLLCHLYPPLPCTPYLG